MNKGVLYLIPTQLGEPANRDTLPAGNRMILNTIRVFIVEEVRTARRFLKQSGIESPLDTLTFLELNEHTRIEDTENYLQEAVDGNPVGLLSEAGLPCVADPGSQIVRLAHRKGIKVVPLIGPSSIMLALMASGFSGQNFQFHGYLPVKQHERATALRQLEKEIQRKHQTQIFIEAPYRNNSLLDTIIKVCHPDTLLCIAADLTLESEYIITMPVKAWKRSAPDIHKRPAVFLLGA